MTYTALAVLTMLGDDLEPYVYRTLGHMGAIQRTPHPRNPAPLGHE